MTKIKYIAWLLLMLFLMPSCEKDDTTTGSSPDSKVLVARADSKEGAFDVKLLADDTLFAGYNQLYLDVSDNSTGQHVDNAVITLHPLMNMVSMKHAAPAEDPPETAGKDGYFKGAVTFVMPDNPDEHWSLGVRVTAGEKSDTVSLPIPVVRSMTESRIVNVVSPLDGKTYFIALIGPSSPEVGINDFELGAWYRQSMMNFPPASDLEISFVPEMPSMGHSSPNNVDPVLTGDGHYLGKVNFTMTGWWRINLTVKQNGEMISDTLSFNVTF